MYHHKKIGVFISHIFGEYQRKVSQGIVDKAKEYGYIVEIFTSMDGENLGEYAIGEENICTIPNFSNLAGVIFASETYLNLSLRQRITDTLISSCTCPVVEITSVPSDFPSIAMDNNSPFKELTKHLIEMHHAKRICYLGNKRDSFFSDQRENYICSTMSDYHLTPDSHDIYHADTALSDITAAYHFFMETGKPDAILCYNDEMALLLMSVLEQNGLSVPNDILITGCDASEEGQYLTPALTSVTFPVYELGCQALEKVITLTNHIDDTTHDLVTASFFPGCSCGCSKDTPLKSSISFQQSLTRRISSLERSMFFSMKMLASFQGVTKLDSAMNLLEGYMEQIPHCKEFYLCLYSDWDTPNESCFTDTTMNSSYSSTDDVLLKFAVRNGKRLPECSFKYSSLLPEYLIVDSVSSYLFTPLFFGRKVFGYIALSFDSNQINYPFHLVHWFLNISQLLQRISSSKQTLLISEQFEDAYYVDSLTGLWNQNGFEKQQKTMYSKLSKEDQVSLFAFQINDLHHIFTTFGPDEYDFSLQILSQALNSTKEDTDICAHFHDSICYVLSLNKKDTDDYLTHVLNYLTHYNNLSKKPYQISVSTNVVTVPVQNGTTTVSFDDLLRTVTSVFS